MAIGWDAGEYIEHYSYWKKGQYPNAGTYREQPHKYLHIMREMEHWIRERQNGK